MRRIQPHTERYRSGHNGADSKSVCLNGHAGSNPALSAKMKRSHFCATFSFSRWVADSNLPPLRRQWIWRRLAPPAGLESRPALWCALFHFRDGEPIRTCLHCASNGYGDAARRRRVSNPALHFCAALDGEVRFVVKYTYGCIGTEI